MQGTAALAKNGLSHAPAAMDKATLLTSSISLLSSYTGVRTGKWDAGRGELQEVNMWGS